MLTQQAAAQTYQIQIWPIDRLVFYARNPRKNDAAVDRMCSSIREFGFKIPVLARSDGEVVDAICASKLHRSCGSRRCRSFSATNGRPRRSRRFG